MLILTPSLELLTPAVLASPRVRRNRRIWALSLFALALVFALVLTRGGNTHLATKKPHHRTTHQRAVPPAGTDPRLAPGWDGDGRPVTFAFAGDVDFPVGSTLGQRLAADPATALGPTVPALLSGANLTMTNFESGLSNDHCPDAQPKKYVFYAPSTAVQAFEGAGLTLVSEANNHGEDCGPPGLQTALAVRGQSGYPILGIGEDAAHAFAPYEATLNGEKIAVIAATQVIDSDLQTAWTATAHQPGLASAYDLKDLISAVESARRVSDTVVVYLHWGTETDDCPNSLQEPLAKALVEAGADIVVGTHAHVLLGGGYLGSAYVDYGLGNFAFYDNSPPEDESGSLVITTTGRRIDGVTWRPAVIVDDLPQPLAGSAATAAIASWNEARGCTNVTATPTTPIATPTTETSAVAQGAT
jgi:poly-gamma-glutamate synthesis protein (capsule biosynthesis protein)